MLRPLLSILLAAPLLQAQALAPRLAAILTTEQLQTTPDGLEKRIRFRERFVRTGDRVWLERILPAIPAPEAADHRHLDLDVAARYVVREGQGAMRLTFVHRGERTLVATEPRDYPEVGFHDSWAVVYHLVDPAVLGDMKPMARRPSHRGAVWYQRLDPEGFLRVEWSPAREIALVVESGSGDGSRFHRTSLEETPFPSTCPWEELAGYREKDYTDLLD